MNPKTLISDDTHKVTIYYNENGSFAHLILQENQLFRTLAFESGDKLDTTFIDENTDPATFLKVVVHGEKAYSVYCAEKKDEEQITWSLVHKYDAHKSQDTDGPLPFSGLPRMSIQEVVVDTVSQHPLCVTVVALVAGFCLLKLTHRL